MAESKSSNWDLAKIAVIITAVSGLLAVLFGPGFLKDAVTPPTPALPTSVGIPTQVIDRGTNWTVAFQLVLPAGEWTAGEHSYTLETKCPGNTQGGKTTVTFNVTDSAAVLDTPVYLRSEGSYTEVFDLLGKVDLINPAQKTIFSVVMQGSLTHADAQDLGAKCRVTVLWDNASPVELRAGSPFLH